MLTLTTEQEAAIRAHGEADYPHECCGLLLGTFDEGGRKTTVEVMPISNAREESAKRNRFLITPQELMRGERYARGKQLDIIGFYHSHPDHPAVPSGYDLDHALPVYSYVIVSVHQGQAAEVAAWEMEADRTRFNPEAIV
ncbi:MAG: M67 family metallopeptidase, partial [Chloracidobacterium sp.]